jgi:electron transfer flavoprotein beta subunit
VKIVVCVKVVPDTSSSRGIDPETFRLDRGGENRLNPPDGHAVTEAVRLREAGEGEVVLLCLGPPESADSLRYPLALGADRAVLVSDIAAAGSDLVATTRVLAAALEREHPDLIIFGQQAVDSNGAVLWAAVADRLRLPMASRAVAVELVGQRATVTCSSERGLEIVELPLPCVIAVSTAINEPRTPTFRELKGAGEKPRESLTLEDLGLPEEAAGEQAARTAVLALAEPESRGERLRVIDDGDAAAAILEFLAARNLV